MNQKKKQQWKEELIVGLVLTLIYLPARLFFYTYISQYWLGSFGLISGISILIVYLSEKQKLGKFGKMFQNQMLKIHKGKRKYLIYSLLGLKLFILVNIIFAIEIANTEYEQTKTEVAALVPNYQNIEEYKDDLENVKPQDYLLALGAVVWIYFYHYDILASMISIFNDQSNGWYLHFVSVAFIELLEIAGLLVYYRIKFKAKHDTKLLLYLRCHCQKHNKTWSSNNK